MSIDQFVTAVKTRGIARTNRFDTIIAFPGENQDTSRLATLFCESSSLPGINLATVPSRVYGEARELPYERMFDPVTLTFFVDAEMKVKTAFDKWNMSIINQQTRSVDYYDNYTRPIFIYVRNVDDTTPCVITLHEAYPKTIGSIQLAAESRELMKVSVTFQYRYWTSSAVDVATAPDPTQDPQSFLTATGFNTKLLLKAAENTTIGAGIRRLINAATPNR